MEAVATTFLLSIHSHVQQDQRAGRRQHHRYHHHRPHQEHEKEVPNRPCGQLRAHKSGNRRHQIALHGHVIHSCRQAEQIRPGKHGKQDDAADRYPAITTKDSLNGRPRSLGSSNGSRFAHDPISEQHLGASCGQSQSARDHFRGRAG